MILIFAFVAAFALTALLVPAVSRLARVWGLRAQPTGERWRERSVPNIGGIAMAVPLALIVWVSGLLPTLWPVMLASGLMFALGLADDLRPMKPATKLVFQMLVASLLLYLAPPIRLTGQPVVDHMLAFFWIVGITNAFNLLDNIDGLAAGVAAIAAAFLLLILRLDGGGSLSAMTVALAAFVGVAAGFLVYNFQPASIFMGDGGSHLLGAFLAGATLVSTPAISTHVGPVAAIPLLLLAVPILDTTFVTLMRGLAGRNAFVGGHDHTSHRLAALGIGERRAVLILYALTFIGGCVAVGLQKLAPGVAFGFVIIYVTVLGFLGVYLGHIEATRDGQPHTVPLLPTELTNRHRAYEVMLDALVLGTAYYLAFLVRFREPELSHFLPFFTRSLPLVVGTQLVAMWLTGKYRQVWQSIGPLELLEIFKGSLLGVAGSVIALLYLHRFEGYSRSVFAFDALIAPMFLLAARVALGGLDEYLRGRRRPGPTALIYGAGRAGELAVKELLQNASLGLTPIGFIDDDPAKRRVRTAGLTVVGSLEHLPALLGQRQIGVAAVVVAIRDLPRETFDRVCAICEPYGVEVRRMRFTLEQVESRDRSRGVVRFPKK